MIQVKDLSYRIGKKTILHQISFETGAGELLAIIGPNGAGKSTLLKILCKEADIPKGKVFLHKKDINAYSNKELARFRSVLAQSNTMNINFTVYDIILMGRYPHFTQRPSAEDLAIVEEVIQHMGIKHLVARMYQSLSGGEQQRVQLARVLAQIHQHPKGMLFLDEPINGLDLQYQQIILEKARMLANAGATVVCILHDINFAAKYADNILILKDGRSVALGPPKEIISEETIFNTYNTKVKLIYDHAVGHPFVIPIA